MSKTNKSYLTAIGRKKPSAPMCFLNSIGLLKGKMLDYGCGRGFDAEYYGMDKYDPHYAPGFPKIKFDTITCNYVLNVVDSVEMEQTIALVLSLLKIGGEAFFTVRRNIKKEGFTSKGTYQRNVVLDFDVLRENSSFCIYRKKL